MPTNKTRKHITYKNSDYNSGDGMLTTVWGPSMWHFLHTMSFNYPVNPTDKDKENYRDFIISLQNVLPCGKCRKNLKRNFKTLPLTAKNMKSRATFSRYVYRLHNVINKMLHKKKRLSYNDIRERYEHFRSRCTKLLGQKTRKRGQKTHDEKGCTDPLYGEKSKCVLRIVPQTEKCETLEIDDKCIKRRASENRG